MKTKLKSILAAVLCAIGLSAMDANADTPLEPEISALSNEFALDLTIGDRIAKDVETIVVDPAWGNATAATVKLQNGWRRNYNCASNDLWDTTELTPGRHSLAYRAGEGSAIAIYKADFWKTGADWVVFDGSNLTADVIFEEGKTYLMIGTNTVAGGKMLTVTDGAKLEYASGAGFVGGEVGELPKRYEQKAVGGDLYQIVEKITGSADNPWNIGEGVTAITNGTELVIGGAGTVTGLSEIPAEVTGGIEAITITEATVTGVASDVFQGIDDISLTLPDGWQGELPDEEGNWYGATGATLTAYPLAVKNVKVQQRYPWNGKVDIGFGVTGPAGETNVVITIWDGEKTLTNFTAAVSIPSDGVLATNLVWDAAGLAATFASDDVTVEVALALLPGQLWRGGPIWAECNIGAAKPEEHGSFTKFNGAAQAVTDAMGVEWRVPTAEDFTNLVNNCNHSWANNYNNTGTNGYVVTSKVDPSKFIFMPAAGFIHHATTHDGSGTEGYYWSSSPNATNSSHATSVKFRKERSAYVTDAQDRDFGMSVRAVREAPPVPATAIWAKSEAGALDLRTSVALPAGEVEVDNITWSATAWGEVPEAVSTDLVWTNETTGASGVLATGLHGPDMAAFDLPTVDGEYRLIHSTGDLISYATFVVSGYPLGSEGNPWVVGEGAGQPENVVTAVSNGTGTVFFKPIRGVATKAGLEMVTNAMGGASFPAKLISEDGGATNDLVMALGASGTAYETIAEALAADETSYTLFEIAGVAYLDWDDANRQMTNALCRAFTVVTDETVFFEAGKTYVVEEDVMISSRIIVDGTPENPTRLILGDGAMLMAPYGIDVSGGYALVVCAQSEDAATMGALTATAYDGDAAIGGIFYFDAGSVTINGGNVTVTGGYYGAGIGGGFFGDGGAVVVNGGVVNAFGGEGDDLFGGPAGIGGGAFGNGGAVVVNGGSVTAVGGDYGAGIGGGALDDDGGSFTLDGGWVFVEGGLGGAGIGGGLGGDGGSVAINGGSLNAVGGLLGPAIGGGYDSMSAGALVFAADAGIVLKVGASETGAVYFPLAVYADDHGAPYVLIESGKDIATLKIPAPTVGFSYVVMNATAGAEVIGASAAGTNDYAFVSNDTYSVTYTLDAGYEWVTAPVANPLMGTIEADTELPDVSAKLKTFPLVIPVAPAGLTYVVSNETAEIVGESAGGVNTYTITYGDTVKVYFTLADGYRYIDAPVNPLVLEYITGAVELNDVAIPAVGLTWSVGAPVPEDVEAYVDPAFTNLAAVVIDNGMPSATNGIDLVALANGFETRGYEPAVTPLNACVKIGQDGGAEYLTPTGWIGEGDTYATLEDAIAAGEAVVVPDFASDEVPVRIAEKGMGADSRTYTAVVENESGEVEKPLQVRRAEGLLELARETTTNITLVATALEEGDFDAGDAADLAAANTNGVADIIDYRAEHVDLAVYFDGAPQHVLDEVLAVHVPRLVNPRNLYRVARIHEGVAESLPVGADNAVAGEYVEILANEIVIHVSRFSIYSLGEITLQPRYGVVVGNGGKTQGEPDPSGLATNFTVNVQGLDIDPADIQGYCVRAKGEAAGEYAVNFVCTSIPQDYDGEFVVTPGVFTITAPEGPFAATGAVTLPKTAKDSEFLKEKSYANWKAQPDMGCVFAGWVAAADASETVTNLLAAAGEAKCAKATLSLKIPAGAQMKPTDVVATWKRLDEDVPEGQAAVMLWCDLSMGTVKGTGLYKLDKDGTKRVSVGATAKAGYVFAGWYLDPGFSQPAAFVAGTGANAKPKDYREKSQTFTVTANTYLFARFVEKTTRTDPITWLRYEGAGYCGADASWLAEGETWYQGVLLPTNGCRVAFGSASLPTVTVSGLPAGVKFDKATFRFTGVPTAASTEKKPFFTVKVSVKNQSGATDVLVRNVRVEPLPAWAVGNFDGYHFEDGVTNGTMTATIGKTGKVSGKTVGWIVPTSFSAAGFGDVSRTEDGALVYAANAMVQYRDPETKKTVRENAPIYVTESPETGLGVMVGADAIDGCTCIQRAWERKDLAFPAFDVKALKDPLELENGLKLKFGAKGKVTVSGKVLGDDGALVAVSGSAYVLPLAWHSTMTPTLFAQTCVYVPPKKNLAEGLFAIYDLLLEGGETVEKIVEVER